MRVIRVAIPVIIHLYLLLPRLQSRWYLRLCHIFLVQLLIQAAIKHLIFDNFLSILFHVLLLLVLTGYLLIEACECKEGCVGRGYLWPGQLAGHLRREPLQVSRCLPLLLVQVRRMHTRMLKVGQSLSRTQGLLLA